MTAPTAPAFAFASTGTPLSAQTLALVADALAWPLLVLRPDAGLLQANLAARRLLRRGQPLLLLPQRQVVPAEHKHRSTFQQALKAASAGRQVALMRWACGSACYSGALCNLAMPAPSEPALLLALSRGVPEQEAAHGDVRAYAQLHGLSGAETRVLERLAQGDNSARAAAALGISPVTVRSHAVNLRQKTGHASVRDLLRTLAALPPLETPPGATGDGE